MTPTHLLFVASGGMGSTHLVASIRATGTPCVEKPNINTWYPDRWPEVIRTEHKKPAVTNLQVLPTPKICKRFLRTQRKLSDSPERFALDPEKTLAQNLLDYFAFLRSHGIACVLEAAGTDGLVSQGGLREVVFLIRDPVQSYLSFAKPQRHLRYIAKLGGIESEGGLAFWSWYWNSIADEYLQAQSSGLDPILIRYESVQEDVARVDSPFLKEAFASFRPRSNEERRLPPRARERLRKQVAGRYERLYSAGRRPIGTS